MKLILLGASWLALTAATPINPSGAALATPASISSQSESTTATAEATQTSVEISETPKAELDNLCAAKDDDNSKSDSKLSLSQLLSLGKLEECAGNTLGEKPVTGVLGGVGSLLGGDKREA